MCDCENRISDIIFSDHYKKEVSQIDNKWILDNLGRKLLVTSPIHDIYGDIVGYVTKSTEDNVIRIFKKNVKQILD
jgi:hypothetical protein